MYEVYKMYKVKVCKVYKVLLPPPPTPPIQLQLALSVLKFLDVCESQTSCAFSSIEPEYTSKLKPFQNPPASHGTPLERRGVTS